MGIDRDQGQTDVVAVLAADTRIWAGYVSKLQAGGPLRQHTICCLNHQLPRPVVAEDDKTMTEALRRAHTRLARCTCDT